MSNCHKVEGEAGWKPGSNLDDRYRDLRQGHVAASGRQDKLVERRGWVKGDGTRSGETKQRHRLERGVSTTLFPSVFLWQVIESWDAQNCIRCDIRKTLICISWRRKVCRVVCEASNAMTCFIANPYDCCTDPNDATSQSLRNQIFLWLLACQSRLQSRKLVSQSTVLFPDARKTSSFSHFASYPTVFTPKFASSIKLKFKTPCYDMFSIWRGRKNGRRWTGFEC